jgi:hypothetical protein
MSSGIEKVDEEKRSTSSVITDITDNNELQEIGRIANRVGKDEKVIFVARQSRFKPGGSKGSPGSFFVTSKRLIVRNTSMMGMRENLALINYDKISSLNVEKGVFSSTLKIKADGFAVDIDAIDKEKAERIFSYIREKIDQATIAVNNNNNHRADTTSAFNPQLSAADELTKLARLKEQRILSEAEFNQMKQEILRKF